jgi:hypothetical protein
VTDVPSPSTTPTIRRAIPVTPALLQALVAAVAQRRGEPLVDPPRVVFSIARTEVEAATNRPLRIEYLQDELNPFGRVDIILED